MHVCFSLCHRPSRHLWWVKVGLKCMHELAVGWCCAVFGSRSVLNLVIGLVVLGPLCGCFALISSLHKCACAVVA